MDPLHSTGGVHCYYSECTVQSVEEPDVRYVVTFYSGKPEWIDQDYAAIYIPEKWRQPGEIKEGTRLSIAYLKTAPGNDLHMQTVNIIDEEGN